MDRPDFLGDDGCLLGLLLFFLDRIGGAWRIDRVGVGYGLSTVGDQRSSADGRGVATFVWGAAKQSGVCTL